jgi:RecG-like helicase
MPNATLMVIENPERLGLAQLHQLRGRVGRGSERSHCVLLYKPPLAKQSRARLKVMRETNDGFRIAEEDLKQRGPGDVLGTRQTGEQQFRVADLAIDGQTAHRSHHRHSRHPATVDQPGGGEHGPLGSRSPNWTSSHPATV